MDFFSRGQERCGGREEDSRSADHCCGGRYEDGARFGEECAGACSASDPGERGLGSLERLRDWAFSARRFEGRSGGFSESGGNRSTESRWVGKYRARFGAGGGYRRRAGGVRVSAG